MSAFVRCEHMCFRGENRHMCSCSTPTWIQRKRVGATEEPCFVCRGPSTARVLPLNPYCPYHTKVLGAPSVSHRFASRRVRGKARTRLRYSRWVNSMDNWLGDEVPKLADYDKRQFPVQNTRQGQSSAVVGSPNIL